MKRLDSQELIETYMTGGFSRSRAPESWKSVSEVLRKLMKSVAISCAAVISLEREPLDLNHFASCDFGVLLTPAMGRIKEALLTGSILGWSISYWYATPAMVNCDAPIAGSEVRDQVEK